MTAGTFLLDTYFISALGMSHDRLAVLTSSPYDVRSEDTH